MSAPHRLFDIALRAVPPEWRESVRRDLLEEASAAGPGGRRRGAWLVCQALAVGLCFRLRRASEGGRVGWRRGFLAGTLTDVRLAARSIRRRPWSALAVASTLGLGIGAATATYAAFNHVVFRPVPGVRDAGRVVTLYYQVGPDTPTRTSAPWAHFVAMRDESPALEGLAAWLRQGVGLGVDPSTAPREIEVTRVTPGYFELLGVRARSGRLLAADDHASDQPVAVVSERFARTLLGEGGSAVVGRTLYLNGRPFTVVGVADDFRGPERLGRDDVWVTYRGDLRSYARAEAPDVFAMLGRLRPGSTLARAQEQVRRASRGAGALTRGPETFEPTLFPGLTDGVGLTERRLMRIYRILMAGVSLLFVLACANAANLLIARNLRRRPDLAMRAALGAARGRLLRELALETVGLATIAGSLGLGIAVVLTRLFRGTRLLSYLPALDDLAVDARVVAFCAGAAALTVLLFGMAPAFVASRTDLRRALADAGRTTPRTGWPRTALVTVQLALSLTLLVGAGLLGRTVWHLRSLDLGLDPDGVVSFQLRPYHLHRDNALADATFREVERRLAGVPGFEAVAVAWGGPFGFYQLMPVRAPGAPAVDEAAEITHYVSPGYFDVFGIPVLAGRMFTDAEGQGATGARRPVLVNEAFAQKWFGTNDVVGRSIPAESRSGDLSLDVVGVVGNVRNRELREGFAPMIYHPAAGHLGRGDVLIRSFLPASRVVALARDVVHEVEPLLPVGEAGTVREEIARHLAEERLLAKLGSVIAALAALLAVAGLYAVVGFFVGERVREFAIHMALGATGRAVAGRLMRRVLGITAVGLAIGFAGVLGSSRLLASRLYGVEPLDPATLAAAALSLTGAALLAAWIPTRRATRIDPSEALRSE